MLTAAKFSVMHVNFGRLLESISQKGKIMSIKGVKVFLTVKYSNNLSIAINMLPLDKGHTC